MKPITAILALSFIAAPVAADWELYMSTCYGFSGDYQLGGLAVNGDVCDSPKNAWWDMAFRERRMNSYNPCNRGGRKLRYVRDVDEYNIYWEGSPNDKIGRCFPVTDPDRGAVCHDVLQSCSYDLMYKCKSPVCTSGM